MKSHQSCDGLSGREGREGVIEQIIALPNSQDKALTSSVTKFGDRTLKKITEFKIIRSWCPYEREETLVVYMYRGLII